MSPGKKHPREDSSDDEQAPMRPCPPQTSPSRALRPLYPKRPKEPTPPPSRQQNPQFLVRFGRADGIGMGRLEDGLHLNRAMHPSLQVHGFSTAQYPGHMQQQGSGPSRQAPFQIPQARYTNAQHQPVHFPNGPYDSSPASQGSQGSQQAFNPMPGMSGHQSQTRPVTSVTAQDLYGAQQGWGSEQYSLPRRDLLMPGSSSSQQGYMPQLTPRLENGNGWHAHQHHMPVSNHSTQPGPRDPLEAGRSQPMEGQQHVQYMQSLPGQQLLQNRDVLHYGPSIPRDTTVPQVTSMMRNATMHHGGTAHSYALQGQGPHLGPSQGITTQVGLAGYQSTGQQQLQAFGQTNAIQQGFDLQQPVLLQQRISQYRNPSNVSRDDLMNAFGFEDRLAMSPYPLGEMNRRSIADCDSMNARSDGTTGLSSETPEQQRLLSHSEPLEVSTEPDSSYSASYHGMNAESTNPFFGALDNAGNTIMDGSTGALNDSIGGSHINSGVAVEQATWDAGIGQGYNDGGNLRFEPDDYPQGWHDAANRFSFSNPDNTGL